jgi:hypothetical protein
MRAFRRRPLERETEYTNSDSSCGELEENLPLACGGHYGFTSGRGLGLALGTDRFPRRLAVVEAQPGL